jgi:hypothetical protein
VEEEIDLGVEGRKVETGVRSLHCLLTTLDARENEVKRADIEKNTQGGYLWIVSTRLRLKTNKTPAFWRGRRDPACEKLCEVQPRRAVLFKVTYSVSSLLPRYWSVSIVFRLRRYVFLIL